MTATKMIYLEDSYMKTEHDNKTLTLYLSGRIAADNAAEIDSSISAAIAEYPELTPAFDAEKLEYISSAGLRVLLKFRKQFGKNLDVLNASNDVYNIFEVTGFTELFYVRKKFREVSIEGCPVIGRGYFSTVYKLSPDTIVKLFNRAPISLERIYSDQQRAREIFIKDIPTAISFDVVKAGEYYGIVYEMIDALSLSGTIMKQPERLHELGHKMGSLLKKLHTTEFPAGTFPEAIHSIYESVKTLHVHALISDSERDMLNGIIDSIPKRNTLIHYDYHPNNILVQGDDLVLIDVGEASLGNPVIDFASAYFVEFSCVKIFNAPADKMEEVLGLKLSLMADLWREMLAEYFGTTDAEKLRYYDELIEGYSMLKGIFIGGLRIGNDNFERFHKPMMRKCVEYLSAHGVKSLEGVF